MGTVSAFVNCDLVATFVSFVVHFPQMPCGLAFVFVGHFHSAPDHCKTRFSILAEMQRVMTWKRGISSLSENGVFRYTKMFPPPACTSEHGEWYTWEQTTGVDKEYRE